jgi:hypothetical protein
MPRRTTQQLKLLAHAHSEGLAHQRRRLDQHAQAHWPVDPVVYICNILAKQCEPNLVVSYPGIRERTWWFRVDRVPLAAATRTIQHNNVYSIPGRSCASIGMASYPYGVPYLRPKSIPTSVSSLISQPSPYVFFGRSYVHSLPSLKHRPFMMLWSRTNSVFVAVFDRLLYHVRSLLSLFLPLLTTMYLHQKRRTILCSCPTS